MQSFELKRTDSGFPSLVDLHDYSDEFFGVVVISCLSG